MLRRRVPAREPIVMPVISSVPGSKKILRVEMRVVIVPNKVGRIRLKPPRPR